MDTRPRRLGFPTATLLVVASMVGTGIFTTSGFLIRDLGTPAAVLWVWIAGGVLSLLGALSYAEIFSAFPENGGEYAAITRLYHPAAGFVAGVVTVLVGFCAPIAACGLAFGEYIRVLGPVPPPRITAALLILFLTGLQWAGAGLGTAIQNALTALKILFVAGLVAAGLWAVSPGEWPASLGAASWPPVFSPAFGLGVVLASYAYFGWNAASYVAGEVKNPVRNITLSLAAGTLLVTILYLGLNVLYFRAAPVALLSGKLEVARSAAEAAFGHKGGTVVSLIISAGIVSTIGAFIITGARVLESLGRDYPAFSFVARPSGAGVPRAAMGLQSALALAMALGVGFEALLTYAGFMLSAFAAFTAAGVFILRKKGIRAPYRVPGYPVTPAVFVSFTLLTVAQAMRERPGLILSGLATLGAGMALYGFARLKNPRLPE